MSSLLVPHPDISMRSSIDKEVETVDLEQLFDQYVESDLFQQLNDTPAEPSSSDDLTHLFELPSSNESEALDTKSPPNWDTTRGNAWRMPTLRPDEQNVASPLLGNNNLSVYPKSNGRACFSDPEFFNFDHPFEFDTVNHTPVSQPSTPKPQIFRPLKKDRSSSNRSRDHGINRKIKSSTLFRVAGNMIQPSSYRASLQDIWTRKTDATADAFNIQMSSNSMHSPRSSKKMLPDENSNGFYTREQQPYAIMVSPHLEDEAASDIPHPQYQFTPLSSPGIESSQRNGEYTSFQFSNDGRQGAYMMPQVPNAALSALQTPPPSHRLPMATWDSDMSPDLDCGFFSTSPELQTNTRTSGWWNGLGSASVTEQSSPNTGLSSHSRSVSHNMEFTTASIAGLGISCDSINSSGFGSDVNDELRRLSASASSLDMAPYSALYPPTPGIPIGHSPANIPSRSPSLSPQPQFTRRRHSAQQQRRSSHHHSRRKSSYSSNQSNPRNGSNSSSGGFVNFTPDDSKKILTGVAPSGSSKTKARREKEAADKRRKLSQAAVKAVIEAGGDVGKLEKEGLLVLDG